MNKDHWSEHAKQWSHIGAPLRPSLEDTRLIESQLFSASDNDRALNAMLLGVTPELALMSWPNNTNLLAIDRNQSMIDGVWPINELKINATAMSGNWLSTKQKTHSMDIVVGDGCLTLLSYLEHYSAFFKEIQRIVATDGNFVIRHFTRPEQAENIEDIFSDLLNGKIGNFHIFKWRLGMALHGSIEEGVKVNEIWETWKDKNIPVKQLVEQNGWTIESINTINNYKGVNTVYTFPTANEVSEISAQYFEQISCHFMDYELGECCPTFFLKPRR